MNELHLVGIGGNIFQPNPRLPAYLFPILSQNKQSIISIVSARNGACDMASNQKEKELILFNTNSKIELLTRFVKTFFAEKVSIIIDFSSETDEIDFLIWLELWNEIEKTFSTQEKEEVINILNRFNKTDSLEKSKVYAIRHAFWFKDLSFNNSLSGYNNIKSIGGKAEIFFNFIRDKAKNLPKEYIENLLNKIIYQNNIEKEIFQFESKVVPYSQATRVSGKNRLSIEYNFGDSGDIVDYYNGNHQKRSGLDSDIALISQIVNISDYKDFWANFQKKYLQDQKNI